MSATGTQLHYRDRVVLSGEAQAARVAPVRDVMKRLLVVNGHPDPRPQRYCGALATAYVHGARTAGWETRRANIGEIALGAIEAFSRGEAPSADIARLFRDIEWSNRLAIVYPLWFDKPPEVLRTLLGGSEAPPRHAHLIVTMDMPAFAYRSMLRPGTPTKAPALHIPGIVADEPALIGCVSSISSEQRRQWIETVRGYGKTSLGAAPAASWTFAAMFDRAVAHLWN